MKACLPLLGVLGLGAWLGFAQSTPQSAPDAAEISEDASSILSNYWGLVGVGLTALYYRDTIRDFFKGSSSTSNEPSIIADTVEAVVTFGKSRKSSRSKDGSRFSVIGIVLLLLLVVVLLICAWCFLASASSPTRVRRRPEPLREVLIHKGFPNAPPRDVLSIPVSRNPSVRSQSRSKSQHSKSPSAFPSYSGHLPSRSRSSHRSKSRSKQSRHSRSSHRVPSRSKSRASKRSMRIPSYGHKVAMQHCNSRSLSSSSRSTCRPCRKPNGFSGFWPGQPVRSKSQLLALPGSRPRRPKRLPEVGSRGASIRAADSRAAASPRGVLSSVKLNSIVRAVL